MAKTRISKKELPYLNRDLDWDETVLKKVQDLQTKHQAKFDRTVEATKKEALARYTKKLDALNKAKSESTKRYNEEIKKYKDLIAKLQSDAKEDTPTPRGIGKTSRKRTTKGKK